MSYCERGGTDRVCAAGGAAARTDTREAYRSPSSRRRTPPRTTLRDRPPACRWPGVLMSGKNKGGREAKKPKAAKAKNNASQPSTKDTAVQAIKQKVR
ncbi:hypothetical protein GCM10023162_36400 [Klenkia terrae]